MDTRLLARRLSAIALLALFLIPASASAQATRTWVSGTGDDVNPCSRTAPCKTFAGAISKTATGGEINAQDPGGYGAVTITKSISIRGGGFNGGILVSAGNGITVNATDSSRVVLKDLNINGLGGAAGASSLNGINILRAANVRVVDCDIYGFGTAGIGDYSSTPHAQLTIRHSDIYQNPGTNTPGANPAPGTTAGVLINPNAAGAKQKISIRHSSIDDNENGVFADGSVKSANVTMVDDTIDDNDGTGITSNGSFSTFRIWGNEITDNLVGLSETNSGQIISFGGNIISGNAVSDGAPTSTQAPV